MLLCRNPYVAAGGSVYGCGQCMPCRVNRRRVWTHRIMLEVTQWPLNSFWTLTYSDDKLPLTEGGLPNLVPKHLTDFMKRLREFYYPNKVRYFNVGEYGETSGRSHYHLALFNFPCCARGCTQPNRRGDCCDICDAISKIWGFGRVHAAALETGSAAYIAGYTTKKMTSKEDSRLCGRHPEFARMSLKPGIGAGILPDVASALLGHNLEDTLTDVPTSLRTQSRVQPLGRYLTRNLRESVGKPPNAPQEKLQELKEKMLPLQEAARLMAPKGTYLETLKSLILEANQGQYSRLEARAKIYKKRGYL